jgi:hypothetical protein
VEFAIILMGVCFTIFAKGIQNNEHVNEEAVRIPPRGHESKKEVSRRGHLLQSFIGVVAFLLPVYGSLLGLQD